MDEAEERAVRAEQDALNGRAIEAIMRMPSGMRAEVLMRSFAMSAAEFQIQAAVCACDWHNAVAQVSEIAHGIVGQRWKPATPKANAQPTANPNAC